MVAAEQTSAGRPDAAHSAPCSNRDYDFFYAGLEREELLIQRCNGCHALRNPPSPTCPHCQSLDWTAQPVAGKGVLFSYVIHHHPPLPGFPSPHPVALIDLEEGVRLVAAMDGTAAQDMAIGMPVEAEFLQRGDVAAVRFKRSGEGMAS